MKAVEVTKDIYALSVDAEGFLFEEMWEIPNGVSINSYIVKGEKTALIDGVCGWVGITEQLYALLDELKIKISDIDYLVINHMEPDHSGWIQDFAKLKPDFEIYCTGMAKKLLKGFFGESEKINVIKPGMKLDLGGGKELEFTPHPYIHWPDTMMTRETSTNTLFPCDLFGSFGKCEGRNFDDEFKEGDMEFFKEEEIRYFSNVMVTFNQAVVDALAKVREMNPAIIAPGHGPIYRKDAKRIIDRYQEIADFLRGKPENEITLVYGSMYGMTEKAVDKILEILKRENVKVNVFKAPYAHIGEVLSKVMRSYGLIFAAPTYEDNMFPPMAAVIDEIGRKKLGGAKKVLCLGSYGWAGGSKKEFAEIVEKRQLDWELMPDLHFAGSPVDKDLEALEAAVMELVSGMKK